MGGEKKEGGGKRVGRGGEGILTVRVRVIAAVGNYNNHYGEGSEFCSTINNAESAGESLEIGILQQGPKIYNCLSNHRTQMR